MGQMCEKSTNVIKAEIPIIIESQNQISKGIVLPDKYKIDLQKLYLDYLNSIIKDIEVVDRLKFLSQIANPSLMDFTNSSGPRNNENQIDAIAREVMVMFFFLEFCIDGLRHARYFKLVDQFINFVKMQLILNLSTYANILMKPEDQWEQFMNEWIIFIIEIQENRFRSATECKPKGFTNIQSEQLTILQEELKKVESFESFQTEENQLAKKIVISLISSENYFDKMKKYCAFLQKHLSAHRAMKYFI